MRRGLGPAAAPGKDLPYAYDRNGNRTQDERGTHAYNARDQLRTWTRATGGAVSYEHDGTGAITRRTEGTDVESSTYNGERLMSTTRGGVTKRYAYDEFGSMTKEGAKLESPETTYTYDAFERLTGGRGPGQAAETTYRYDGLDRRDYRTENGTRYDSSYVGSTEALAREQDPGKTQTYDYDSAGQSQGQATSRLGASTYRSFAKDANGSVEGLEGALGEITPASRYDYDPYGKLENEQAILDPAAKDNPIRFEGFRYDSGLKTYDMQARQYRPDIGRFLTRIASSRRAGTSSCSQTP
jgi:RHS repeat-associated protein